MTAVTAASWAEGVAGADARQGDFQFCLDRGLRVQDAGPGGHLPGHL